MPKHNCKTRNETSLWDENKKQWYIVCNVCFNFIRWEVINVK